MSSIDKDPDIEQTFICLVEVNGLTIGKHYTTQYYHIGSWCSLVSDTGAIVTYAWVGQDAYIERFITLQEHRDNQLNKIL